MGTLWTMMETLWNIMETSWNKVMTKSHWGCGCAKCSTPEKSGVGTHLNGEPQDRVPRDQLTHARQALVRRYQVQIPMMKVVNSDMQGIVIHSGIDRRHTHPGMDRGKTSG